MVPLTLKLEEWPREAETLISQDARAGVSERGVRRLVLQVMQK